MGKPDREAAIARLLRIADRERDWMEEIGLPDASSIGAFLRDVAEMLREQEPAKVTTRQIPANGGSIVWTCGKCGADLAPNNAKAKYCSNCGKAVKWDAAD